MDGCITKPVSQRLNETIGFSPTVDIQRRPTQIERLKNITNLAAGSQHVLAIDLKCNMYSWGCGHEGQLGSRVPLGETEEGVKRALLPRAVANLPVNGAKADNVACGPRTSFALDEKGRLYAWGINSMSQLGIKESKQRGGGSQGHIIRMPRLVKALEGHRVKAVAGGRYHSLACTDEGELFTWGLHGDGAVGPRGSSLDNQDDIVLDGKGNPYIVTSPIQVPGEHPPFSFWPRAKDF